jgi:hypothetical protein
MFIYGMVKIIPVQMQAAAAFRHVLSHGAALELHGRCPDYQIFAGCAEVAGGLLLIVPRTATLGALISIADMVQVLILDISYDVPVRLLAFNLILLSCFLLAPDVPRLVRFLLLNRATAPSTQVRLFRGIRANRIALAAQIIVGLWLIGVNFHQCRIYWNTQGGGRPLPPFYGIWEVRQMSIDEQPRPPLLTDSTRWRRAIVDFPSRSCAGQYTQVIHTQASVCMAFQRLDDSFAPYGASVNLRTELSPSRRVTTRTGGQASHFRGLLGTSSSTLFLRSETELMLKSRRVIPGRLAEAGFQFQFPEWESAAQHLVRRWRAPDQR